jgi:hypothetical protein
MQAARAEALFASHLQPSESPDGCQVQRVVAQTVRRLGRAGCAGRVAQEFGDHPDTAPARMRWARALVADAFDHNGRFAPPVPATAARAA